MVEKDTTKSIKKPLPFGARLAHALTLPGNENGFARLVADLEITRQAVTKLLNGGSKEMGANNSARAARSLNVDPIWLATGEGVPRSNEFQVRWHERKLIEDFRELPPEDQEDVYDLMRQKLDFVRHHAGKRTAEPFKLRPPIIDSSAPVAPPREKKSTK